jgi:hypothetical protein
LAPPSRKSTQSTQRSRLLGEGARRAACSFAVWCCAAVKSECSREKIISVRTPRCSECCVRLSTPRRKRIYIYPACQLTPHCVRAAEASKGRVATSGQAREDPRPRSPVHEVGCTNTHSLSKDGRPHLKRKPSAPLANQQHSSVSACLLHPPKTG